MLYQSHKDKKIFIELLWTKGEVEGQVTISGILLHMQPLLSAEQNAILDLEFSRFDMEFGLT